MYGRWWFRLFPEEREFGAEVHNILRFLLQMVNACVCLFANKSVALTLLGSTHQMLRQVQRKVMTRAWGLIFHKVSKKQTKTTAKTIIIIIIHQHLSQNHGKAYQIQRLGNRGWANVGVQINNSPGGYGSPWHHQEGHGKLHQQNPWKELQKITLLSTAHLLRWVETLFASQSPWFGLGCWERKSIAITLVYLL